MGMRASKLLPALLLTVCTYAGADNETDVVDILTCNLKGGDQHFSDAAQALEARAKSDGNGGYRIEGPFRLGELCIRNAHFAGAFGVFMASASLCSGDAKPFIDFLKTRQSKLTLKAPPPGVISAFEAPNFGVSLFRGEPSLRAEVNNPASKRLSYSCAYAGSGPQ
jgi:hypothetical protein